MNSSHSFSSIISNSTRQLSSFPWMINQLMGVLYQCLTLMQDTLIQIIKTIIHNSFNLRLQLHPYGYCYAPIVCNRLMELLILQWPTGSESKPHGHGASINFTRVLSGRVLERKYHISGGHLCIISERVIETRQWAWTLPFEIHELVALDMEAETLHLYLPGRLCK